VVNTIGVVGGGVVGHATARSFMEWAEVRVYDRDPAKRTHTELVTLESDLVFVCLPEGKVSDWFTGLNVFGGYQYRNFVIKSTVPIGTTRKVAGMGFKTVVHSPEFLTARCAVTDAQLPSRNVVGLTGNGFNAPEYRDLLSRRFPGVPVLTMSSDESEAVKIIQNAFFAVKVAFFNEAEELCDKLGLDWETVHDAILADGRIAHSHTRVPGPDGRFGFGGACLPKDLNQFIKCSVDAGLFPLVSQGAAVRNEGDRERV